MLLRLMVLAAMQMQVEAPPDAAQIDRLLEVLPYSERHRDPAPDPQLLADVQALNPGRAEEVRQLLESQRRCESAVLRENTRNTIGELGRRLGRAKIDRLIDFYSGPDFQAFVAIQDRADRGEPSSEADLATMDRIMTDYPVLEMAELLTSGELTAVDAPDLLNSFERCLHDRNSAFDQAGLRLVPDEAD